jgi:hypothetical protein
LEFGGEGVTNPHSKQNNEILRSTSGLADCCEKDNETYGFIKGREFIEQLSHYERFKKNSAPWR